MSEKQPLETQLALLKRDIDDANKLFDKIDNTVTKLNEIAEYLSTLVKLHEERIKGVHIEIERINNDIDEIKKEIAKDVSEIKTEVKQNMLKLQQKIDYYDKIKWMIIGASAVIGYLIAQMDVLSLFS